VRTRRSAATTRAARRGVRGRAGLEAADGDDLVPGLDSDGEGAGPAAQDSVGAVVEWLKGWADAAPTDPEEGGGEEVAWQIVRQPGARIVPRQRNSRNMQSFRKKIYNSINWDFFILQKFIRQHNGSAKNCLSRGKTSVFPQLCSESEEHKG
jgi:hypothetical protein